LFGVEGSVGVPQAGFGESHLLHQFPVQLLDWSFIFDVILDLFLYLLIDNLTSLLHLNHLNFKPAGLLDQTEQVIRDIFDAYLD
jgi:hypothetical protein